MQGHETITAVETQPCGCSTGPAGRQLRLQAVDHDVSDQSNPRFVDSFALQVGDAARFGDKKQIGDSISQEPVDLFGHRAVEAAQSRFNMRDTNPKLYSGEGAGHGTVDVAKHDGARWWALDQMFLVALDDPRRLRAMHTRADVEMNVWRRDAELLEKHVGHRRVVVLTGVDDANPHVTMGREATHDRCELHEIWARAGH